MFKKILSALLVSAIMIAFVPTMSTVNAVEIQYSAENTMELSLAAQDFGKGYGVEAVLTNNTTRFVKDWKIVLNEELTIDSIWCTDYVVEDGKTVITPLYWDQTMCADGSLRFGFNGTGDFASDISYTVYYLIDNTWLNTDMEEPLFSNDHSIYEIDLKGFNYEYDRNGDTRIFTLRGGVRRNDVTVNDIVVYLNDDNAYVDSIEYNLNDGCATITVVAEDGSSGIYYLYIKDGPSMPPGVLASTELAGIIVGDFRAHQVTDTEYAVVLPDPMKLTDITSEDFRVQPRMMGVLSPVQYNPATGKAYVSVTSANGLKKTIYTIHVREYLQD